MLWLSTTRVNGDAALQWSLWEVFSHSSPPFPCSWPSQSTSKASHCLTLVSGFETMAAPTTMNQRMWSFGHACLLKLLLCHFLHCQSSSISWNAKLCSFKKSKLCRDEISCPYFTCDIKFCSDWHGGNSCLSKSSPAETSNSITGSANGVRDSFHQVSWSSLAIWRNFAC